MRRAPVYLAPRTCGQGVTDLAERFLARSSPSGQLSAMHRSFNTAGPVRSGRDYCVPPLERFDLDEVLGLIRVDRP